MNQDKITICYFGTYRANYKHNREMITRLQMAGANVIECHVQLWHGEDDRIAVATGGWRRPSFWLRLVSAYWSLIRKHKKVKHYDIMFVSYPGYLDVYLARILSWLRRKPLVWDILMSLYILAVERDLENTSKLLIHFVKLIERIGSQLPDKIIVDTREYRKWYMKSYGIPTDKFWLIPFGANNQIFKPSQHSHQSPANGFVVLYYGGYVPNHGTAIIVETARLLRDNENISFKMIGTGPEKKACEDLVREYNLTNIKFIDWMEQETLVNKINQADICLGSFGNTPHGKLTVQNKIYECLACAKPVITGESPAIREILLHRENVYLIIRGDPGALADAIIDLYNNNQLRCHIAQSGYQVFYGQFTNQHIGNIQKEYIFDLLSANK